LNRYGATLKSPGWHSNFIEKIPPMHSLWSLFHSLHVVHVPKLHLIQFLLLLRAFFWQPCEGGKRPSSDTHSCRRLLSKQITQAATRVQSR
jgi:hypothetical protein